MGGRFKCGEEFLLLKKSYLIIFSEFTINQYNYNYPRLNKLECKPKKRFTLQEVRNQKQKMKTKFFVYFCPILRFSIIPILILYFFQFNEFSIKPKQKNYTKHVDTTDIIILKTYNFDFLEVISKLFVT